MFISPSEPAKLRKLGHVCQLPEKYGCDILIIHKYMVGIQRKKFPEDFIASIRDGRLQRQLIDMEKLHTGIMLLEGTARFTATDKLRNEFIEFTLQQLRSMIWSFQIRGIHTHWTKNLTDTINYLRMFDVWLTKSNHNSLLKRPKPHIEISRPGLDKKKIYFLQGLDGISVTRAMNILEYFGGKLPFNLTATEQELSSIPTIGDITARKMCEFFGY